MKRQQKLPHEFMSWKLHIQIFIYLSNNNCLYIKSKQYTGKLGGLAADISWLMLGFS